MNPKSIHPKRDKMKLTLDFPNKITEEAKKAIYNLNTESEIDKLNACCFWLINLCVNTNAKSLKVNQDNVHHLGKQLSNWKITVKKL